MAKTKRRVTTRKRTMKKAGASAEQKGIAAQMRTFLKYGNDKYRYLLNKVVHSGDFKYDDKNPYYDLSNEEDSRINQLFDRIYTNHIFQSPKKGRKPNKDFKNKNVDELLSMIQENTPDSSPRSRSSTISSLSSFDFIEHSENKKPSIRPTTSSPRSRSSTIGSVDLIENLENIKPSNTVATPPLPTKTASKSTGFGIAIP